MNYLLDSNSLIDSARDFYRATNFPCVWEKLSQKENIFMLENVYKELSGYGDKLSGWVIDNFKDRQFSIDDKTIVSYAQIQEWISTCGYWKPSGFSLWSTTDKADPWLIATAMSHRNFTIVSHEKNRPFLDINRPSKKEPKITSVADQFKVKVIPIYDLLSEINFVDN
ncbi:DUF4411 family protein [Oenococcus oeni]|uniref:DUF4411 family protein n=1 Tax=Oenococcus oeni TaxID=1247 RepID=A0AAJ2UBG4_OENOE|nr:DUF4411 family protein [Oenococcus oeni]MDV7715265.1 DUF4411 family protein [Oenococcus oeni]